MAKNYAALARSVIAALGGVDNISAVTHCMTRLRFVIKDDQLIDSPTLKTIPGVLGVVRSDNQCQVIIGNTVSQAFQEVVSLLPGDMQPAQPVGKPKLTLRRIGAGIDAPRDKCTLSCAINGIHAAFHYLKKNYISGCVMTVPTG